MANKKLRDGNPMVKRSAESAKPCTLADAMGLKGPETYPAAGRPMPVHEAIKSTASKGSSRGGKGGTGFPKHKGAGWDGGKPNKTGMTSKPSKRGS